ncbi:MAG: type transport system permease protein [Betaproteobacteria bacterium]|jgi:ABC-2 type transport system permease protein|nr:type transport system permease protein [Betaproteobacteria bacterium]
MRILLALWMKEWLALARDVHGLAVLFLMPAAFIVIMSLALSDVFRDGGGRPVDFAVFSADGSETSEALAKDIAGEGFKATSAPGSEAAAREQVRKGRPALVLVVPAGFGADPGVKLKLLADPTLPPVQIAAFLQRVQGAAMGVKSSSAPLTLEVVGNPRDGKPSSVQQNVPAWLIFGMFFVVMPISALFIIERRDGTLARLVSQRVPFPMLLLGKVGPFFVINLAQAVLMLAAGCTLVPWLGGESLALPARWDLLAMVAASTSLAAIGWGLLVAVASRTIEQATVIGGVGNILAAALGGIMVPRFVMPESMQPWAALSPMAWALDGFHAVLLRQGSAGDIAVPCAKLLGLAAALLAAAFWLHQRRRAS